MLYISRFRFIWAKLPSHQIIESKSMLLHLYTGFTGTSGPTSDLSAVFASDPSVQSIVKENDIGCYIEEVSHLHPEVLKRLEIKTVPIIVGIHKGRSVGEFTGASYASCASDLCQRLVEAQRGTAGQSETAFYANIAAEIRTIISENGRDDSLMSLYKLQSQYTQRLEVDDKLRKMFARAMLELYNPNHDHKKLGESAITLDVLKEHLNKIDDIISKLHQASVDSMIAWYNSAEGSAVLQSQQPTKFNMTSWDHTVVSNDGKTFDGKLKIGEHDRLGMMVMPVSKVLKEFLDEHNYEHITGSSAAGTFSDMTRARLTKLWIMQNISVILFFKECVDEALKVAIEGYECLVDMLKKDIISSNQFEKHDIGHIIELMFSALPYNHPAVLDARAALETVDGPRLLNRIPESSRPLGGPVSKRRGFGGRYLWHGPDYRPKKYKPRDPEQYLNEWRYQPDRNLPTF